ncbi:MAG: hypothetical protein D6681_18005 [Calditrichaeota bacterium]|nr:MAG: hypothetical protein D6681_18005 [Calditrichota bacterium]
MSTTTGERLYHLLPAIYRIRDAEQGEPLRALLAILEGELVALEQDIAGLYDDWFIETCAEWVVPYLADLLGVRNLHNLNPEVFTLRPYVANTLAYRRRKGTAAMLEQLARDVTGWPARAVEYFQLLGTTQHLNHLRMLPGRTPDLREMDALERLGGAFENTPHTAGVRRIATGWGRYNIPNVGLFVWRIQEYTLRETIARPVEAPSDGRYFIHPVGIDAPLFNTPQTEREITHIAGEANVPAPLRRLPLYAELEAYRQAIAEGQEGEFVPVYFGDNPVFRIFVNEDEAPIPPAEVLIADLSDPLHPVPDGWPRPPTTRSYRRSDGVTVDLPIRVAVDPVLGRIAFPAGTVPDQVRVTAARGFSGDVGGGPYDRRDSVGRWLDAKDRPVTWQMGVTKDPRTLASAPDPAQLVTTLSEAVEAWNIHVQSHPDAFGVIAVMDNRTYEENLTGSHAIEMPAGSKLAIVAADWPEVEVPGIPGQTRRVVGDITPVERRPHLLGNVSARGIAAPSDFPQGELILDGLLIEGRVSVLTGNLERLRIHHCTLIPGEGGLEAHSSISRQRQNSRLRITLYRSICGKIELGKQIPGLEVEESLIDREGGVSILAGGTAGKIEGSTLLGSCRLGTLEAGNAIFAGEVAVERIQTGCVRYSYVRETSRTPRRFRCQPDLALQRRAGELGIDSAASLPPEEARRIYSRLRPDFTARRYGHYGYGQLSRSVAEEIQTGAEDGTEMGVFGFLQQPHRLANLRVSLEEYLRVGLEAGIFLAT